MRAQSFIPSISISTFLLLPSIAHAQGTLPIALQQQFSFTNCATFTNACGTPLQGGLLYFYQAGTVATVQQSFQDTGLSITNPWPLPLDANGRIPLFYLANGAVHVRLTDSTGVVQFDIPNALVIGPSSGGGGGGSVDPTTVLSTGDIKFRMTTEFVSGWVKVNAQTIGSAASGATQRANADTQNLFVYLWNNCASPTGNSANHCPVSGGLGANAVADFSANKQIQLPDWRGRGPMGVDDMGNSAAGRLVAQNVTSGGSDSVTTPGASGGESLHTMGLAEMVSHSHTGSGNVQDFGHTHGNFLTDPGHAHSVSDPGHFHFFSNSVPSTGAGTGAANITGVTNSTISQTQTSSTGISINGNATNVTLTNVGAFSNIAVPSLNINSTGSTTPFNQMQPFILGSWYIKL